MATMSNEIDNNKNPMNTREGLLFLAQFAMKSKDYRYMFDYMKNLIQLVMPNQPLSASERDCFASACELLVDIHLDSWRYVTVICASPSEPAREYREMIAGEISDVCMEIVEFIDRCLRFEREGEVNLESLVFYEKMKGDYLRHVAMVKNGLERVKDVEDVLEAYNVAMEEALELPEVNLTRLKLALNLALFHAEICESLNMACSVAREAVDMAKRSIERTGEEICSETTAILKELQNHIDSWMAKIAVDVTSEKP